MEGATERVAGEQGSSQATGHIVPGTASGRPGTAPELVERDDDLAWLGRIVDHLIRDRVGATAVIEGPPGIGKSRLLLAATRSAEAQGAVVLDGHGSALEHRLAFGTVRELLAGPVEALDGTERDRVIRGPAAFAMRILTPMGSAPEATGDPMFGLMALVSNLAERGPLILALDDIQWVDDASADFLAYLTRRIAGQPIAVLATRGSAPGEPNAAVVELVRSAETRTLGPLSREGVARVLASTLRSTPSNELATASLRVTGGTPLLVEEMGRALARVPEAARVGAVDEIGPASVGRAVLDRIRLLPDAAAALARTVALFADGASLGDAAAVAGIEPSAAATAADALVAAGVFAPRSTLRFLHPMMRAAVHGEIGPFERRQSHVRAARVLLERGAEAEEVAAHLLAGEPSGEDRHVDVLEAASVRAEQAGALRAAARYLGRALDEPPSRARRGSIRAHLGRLQIATGSPEAAATLRLALEDATTPTERVDRSIQVARACLNDGSHADDAVEILLAAREEARSIDTERSLLVDGLLATAAWESSRYPDLYGSVTETLPRSLPGATPAERLVLTRIAFDMLDRCEPHDRVADVARRAIPQGRTSWSDDPVDSGDAVNLLISCGALDDAEAVCRASQGQARASGADALYQLIQVTLTRVLWLRGAIRECEAASRLALESPDAANHPRAIHALWLASVCIVTGAYDEAERTLDAVATDEGSFFGLAIGIQPRRARLALARGRPQEALRWFERARAGLVARGSTNPAESTSLLDTADALAAAGRRDDAIALVRGLLPDAERFGEPRPLGLVHMGIGRYLGGRDGLAHLRRSVDILSASPYRLDEARARLALGEALRRADHPSEARAPLRHALDFAHREGLQPMSSRARDELLAAGGRPRRAAVSGVEALTPSEERIARLAAGGMTNREIADHLFLTVKTIEMHLANAFGKLEIGSRRDLAGKIQGGSL